MVPATDMRNRTGFGHEQITPVRANVRQASQPSVPTRDQQRLVQKPFQQRMRGQIVKLPGVAETLDWAEALNHLHTQQLDAATINHTLGIILKYQDDVDKVRGRLVDELLDVIRDA